MPELYSNKYRIASARKQDWDYSSDGGYFITICTRNRNDFFGKIVNGEMRLSAIGEIARDELLKTPQIRKNILLDEWIVMPNHIHSIFIINNYKNSNAIVETTGHPRRDDPYRDDPAGRPYKPADCIHNPPPTPTLKPNSLGSIIGQIKSIVTKRVWEMGYIDFGWQPRFHDHIIHNDGELDRIRKYIYNNPKNWGNDKNNK